MSYYNFFLLFRSKFVFQRRLDFLYRKKIRRGNAVVNINPKLYFGSLTRCQASLADESSKYQYYFHGIVYCVEEQGQAKTYNY